LNIIFYIHPESQKQIKYYRGTQGEERNINKIFTDYRGCNAHPFANRSTNAKHLPLNKMFYFIHKTKLKYIYKNKKQTKILHYNDDLILINFAVHNIITLIYILINPNLFR
jgi:hypothetical protein